MNQGINKGNNNTHTHIVIKHLEFKKQLKFCNDKFGV
jgi:hypothetical protein